MHLGDDLTSRRLIVLKGVLFALMVVLGAGLVLIYEAWWLELLALGICLWGACRFYYFLFYVLERYVGVEGRYAGLVDLLQRLWRGSANQGQGAEVVGQTDGIDPRESTEV